MANSHATLEKIMSWAKRRGFIFQTSDIYGGLANNYDYGPYGTLLKNKVRDLWWQKFVRERDDIVGLDGAIITHPRVWEASGHVDGFNELVVEDTVNNKRHRADHLIENWAERKKVEVDVESMTLEQMNAYIAENKILSPDGNAVSEIKLLNQLFETKIGAVEGDKDIAYLRGETAQSIFSNFKNVADTMRVKIPFGIAQVGKAFRNEITKGQFLFRTIEFEQMEIEYFIAPDADWETMLNEWLEQMKQYYLELGAAEEDIRFRQHTEEELSHYSKRTYDPEYEFEFGWKEAAGLAYRTDFDLSQHAEFSGKKMEYRDPYTNEVYTPHVIEPSFGLARATLISMYAAYTEEDLGEGKTRMVMKFPAKIAPITAAVFPLQKDEKLQGLSKQVYNSIKSKFDVEYDNAGNIGKMYRRQDEIGTPFCIVVDFDSLEDNMVTIRDRDTMEQERVAIDEVENWLQSKLD